MKATYTISFDTDNVRKITTFRVWMDSAGIRSRTFKTLEEATEFYTENEGVRLDKIVIEVLIEGG